MEQVTTCHIYGIFSSLDDIYHAFYGCRAARPKKMAIDVQGISSALCTEPTSGFRRNGECPEARSQLECFPILDQTFDQLAA